MISLAGESEGDNPYSLQLSYPVPVNRLTPDNKMKALTARRLSIIMRDGEQNQSLFLILSSVIISDAWWGSSVNNCSQTRRPGDSQENLVTQRETDRQVLPLKPRTGQPSKLAPLTLSIDGLSRAWKTIHSDLGELIVTTLVIFREHSVWSSRLITKTNTDRL